MRAPVAAPSAARWPAAAPEPAHRRPRAARPCPGAHRCVPRPCGSSGRCASWARHAAWPAGSCPGAAPRGPRPPSATGWVLFAPWALLCRRLSSGYNRGRLSVMQAGRRQPGHTLENSPVFGGLCKGPVSAPGPACWLSCSLQCKRRAGFFPVPARTPPGCAGACTRPSSCSPCTPRDKPRMGRIVRPVPGLPG